MANNTGQKFGGRTKGTQNKTTSEIRANFQQLIENNIKQLEDDLKELKPFDRIKVILELSKFVIPTLKATELTSIEPQVLEPIVIKFLDNNDNEINSIK